MSAVPDLMSRIAELTRERDEARAVVARVRKVVDQWDDSMGRCRSRDGNDRLCPSCITRRQVVNDFRAALDPPADRLCECRGGADVCPPCRARRFD